MTRHVSSNLEISTGAWSLKPLKSRSPETQKLSATNNITTLKTIISFETFMFGFVYLCFFTWGDAAFGNMTKKGV